MIKRLSCHSLLSMLGACCLCLLLASPAAAQDEGIGQRIGKQLDIGLKKLSEEVREGWSALRDGVNRFGVQARVYSRLRWDKKIATADIEVAVQEGGVVTLSGRLKDEVARQKAIELANDTVGVQSVVDQIVIARPPDGDVQ